MITFRENSDVMNTLLNDRKKKILWENPFQVFCFYFSKNSYLKALRTLKQNVLTFSQQKCIQPILLEGSFGSVVSLVLFCYAINIMAYIFSLFYSYKKIIRFLCNRNLGRETTKNDNKNCWNYIKYLLSWFHALARTLGHKS